ncbi:hypothetical protein PANA5342_1532 [Pantoea ananatis LMG 5342]|nr:hypothetical protein PANA5342_1532 [Pantoea ananatis LMG 5342]
MIAGFPAQKVSQYAFRNMTRWQQTAGATPAGEE